MSENLSAQSSLLKREIQKLQTDLEQLQITKKLALAEYETEAKKSKRIISENAALVDHGNELRGSIFFYSEMLEKTLKDVKDKKAELEGVIKELVDRRKDLQKVREELNGNT